jgi:four helix bundle protein
MSDTPIAPPPAPAPAPGRRTETIIFGHERLDAYRIAIRFVGVASRINSELPSGHSSLAQQLYRASISIPLNIAEGSGEFSKRDKARFYRMALRSATECAAILDVCRELELSKSEPIQQGREHLNRIVAMLTAMAKSFSGAGAGAGGGAR